MTETTRRRRRYQPARKGMNPWMIIGWVVVAFMLLFFVASCGTLMALIGLASSSG